MSRLIPYTTYAEYENLLRNVEQHYINFIKEVDMGGRFKNEHNLLYFSDIREIEHKLIIGTYCNGIDCWKSLVKHTNDKMAQTEADNISLVLRFSFRAALRCLEIPPNWTHALDQKIKEVLCNCVRDYFHYFEENSTLEIDNFQYFEDTHEPISNYMLCELKLTTVKALKRPQRSVMGLLSSDLLKKIWSYYYAIRYHDILN